MIKLIVSDLDGTLLDESIKVRESDIEMINQAIGQGITFCLATGRKDRDIVAVLEMLDRSFHRISQNGAFIVMDDETDLHSTFFEPAIAKKLYHHVKDKEVLTFVSTRHDEMIQKKNEIVEKIEKFLFSPITENPNLHEEIGVSIQPSKIVVTGYDEVIKPLQKELLEQYPDELDAYISAPYTLDLMPKNISKGNAVKKLAGKIGIDPSEIACIGDSFNDVPMFQMAQYSFAMSKAKPEVKEHATYEVESVGEAIKMVLEINSSEK
jgi:Cof subfamily protein (haloacid dehalogenase superfamily)